MTTIAYRNGILAADSCYTEDSEAGGSRCYQTQKLFRVNLPDIYAVAYVGLAGDQSGLLFLRWLRDGMDSRAKPEFGKSDDFSALVVIREAELDVPLKVFSFDTYCEPEEIVEPYHAIGSGSKAAFVAMDMRATALGAVKRAARRDPYTRAPFHSLNCLE